MIEYAVVAMGLAIVISHTMLQVECWMLKNRLDALAERLRFIERRLDIAIVAEDQ